MARFRYSFGKFMPSWLTTGDGELVAYSLRLVVDADAQRAKEGALARFPQHGPNGALSHDGRDRKIVRGIEEPADSYAGRLVAWLDSHRTRGNPFALCRQIRAYCNAAVRVRTVDQRGNWFTLERDGTESFVLDTGNWHWDAAYTDADWGRFWVIIYPTADNEPWAIGDVWGSQWGGAWGSSGYTWGTTATPGQVAAVRQIVRDWKPAGTRCECVIIAFDDSSFDPAAPEPDGDWVNFGVGVPRQKNRLSTARYWAGTAG
jgi:hypothetical protein